MQTQRDGSAAVGEFTAWLHASGFEVHERGVWASVGKSSIQHGWKLHLSSIQIDAVRLLESVAPVLARSGVAFKIAKDPDVLALLNEGSLGATQCGKFMTIYPETPELCVNLAATLTDRTSEFRGPEIVTDMHLGGVVYTRYGTFHAQMVRDRLGNLSEKNGGLTAYQVPFSPPAGITNPFEDAYRERPRADKAPIGPGYLLVDPLNTHRKGSVYLALDLRDQNNVQKVVIKEGRCHCLSDDYGRDVQDRLKHQYTMHERLKNKVRVPVADNLFEHHNNLYLPLEWIDGTDLMRYIGLPYAQRDYDARYDLLQKLHKLGSSLKAIHDEGIVHRDLSPRNIRCTESGDICILDLELCHELGDGAPPYSQGTPGYMSPQQKSGSPPAIADDVYSIGAVACSLICGLDASRMVHAKMEQTREAALKQLSGAPKELIVLIERCLRSNASERPHLEEFVHSIECLDPETTSAPSRRLYQPTSLNSAIGSSLRWLVEGGYRDQNTGMWLSPEISASSHDDQLQHPGAYRLYRSASRGVAGVVYTISRLKKMGFEHGESPVLVGKAVDWLLDHRPTPDDQMPGLHYGEAGVAVSICEALSAELITRGDWVNHYLNEALCGELDWPDLTHGAAGQGLSAIICADLLKDSALAKFANRCVDYLMSEQCADGSWKLPAGVPSLEDQKYTGFAHGTAGIAYFLCEFSKRTRNKEVTNAALRAIRWVIRNSKRTHRADSIVWDQRADGGERWHWWCHGGPGIAVSLLSAFELTGDSEYSNEAHKALTYHEKNIRYPNLSQCHGLSGLGEIYLTAYAALGDGEWLERARTIGDTLLSLQRRESSGSAWLVENSHHPTADLMVGSSGVVHFLARLHSPVSERVSMPLSLT